MSDNLGRALEWDDEIQKDDAYQLLEPGDYNFTITNFERSRYEGGKKVPACNKAVLTMRIYDDLGNETLVATSFLLHSSMEWKISEIHRAVGLKKHGEKLRMKWKEMVGLGGRCKVTIREYTKQNGDLAKANQVEKFYDPKPGETFTNMGQEVKPQSAKDLF